MQTELVKWHGMIKLMKLPKKHARLWQTWMQLAIPRKQSQKVLQLRLLLLRLLAYSRLILLMLEMFKKS